jgi:hypothetical protein
VHWHQRSYSAEQVAQLWEGRAGAVAQVFCGARWRWSSPLVVRLLHLINGRHYAFEHAQCPYCGASYRSGQTGNAALIERRLDSMHYALALTGRIPWPHRSEIVMLFDKASVASKQYVPTEDDHAPPSTLPSQMMRADLSNVADPDNYARQAYLVPGPAKMAALFLPRLPARIRATPDMPLAFYDPLTQLDVPLRPATEGWHEVPAVAASRFETTKPFVSISIEGEVDPWLPEALSCPRDAALGDRIQELSKLNEELEGKRTAGEERIEGLLRLCSELEAGRDQSEHRVQELLKLAEELEGKRRAGEERIETLLGPCSELEAGRDQAEHRVQELLKLAEELEAKRALGEQRIDELLRLCSELEASRDQAEHLVQHLSKLTEELEGKRAAGEKRIEALLRLCTELEAGRDRAEHRVKELLNRAEELGGKRTAVERGN